MRFSILLIASLPVFALLFGCQQPGNDGNLGGGIDTLIGNKYDEWNDRDSAETHVNQIQSGIIHMKSTRPIHGSDVERVIHFDDYGHKRRTETTTIIRVGEQRVTTTQITLDVDGVSYKFDPEKKIGYRSKISRSFNPTQIDFTRLDKITMEDFGIKRAGSENVAGKDCIVYTIDYPAMNFKGRYAVWNNLPLHEEFSTADFGYEYLADKLEDNADIPESVFAVPADIEFQDAASPQETPSDAAAVDSMLRQPAQ
jgi:hypothetical protein